MMGNFCCTEPLEVLAVWFYCPPLEVGAWYLSGASCLGMSGDTGFLGVMDSIVRQFSNIVWTASIAANCESQMLVGTSLIAAGKSVWYGSFCLLLSRVAA